MSFRRATRREFLAAAGAFSASARSVMGGFYHPANTTPAVRKDVRDLSPDEVDKYREAFRRIQALEPRPRGWVADRPVLPSLGEVLRLNKKSYTYWAMLHTYFCPHGNWWFLPWHRAYLHYFERVLQAAVRDYKSAVPPPTIPYWNWTEQRDVPEIFQGSQASNPIGNDRRFFQGLDEGDVGEGRLRSSVDGAPTFSLFGSSPGVLNQQTQASPLGASDFEEGPHGMVHVMVGYYDGRPTPGFPRTGRPGDFRTPTTAALDPIFWSHHANIDRLWNRWLTNPRHQNPRDNVASERDWGRQRFTEFVDGDGSPVDRSVREIVDDPLVRGVVYKLYSGGLVVSATAKAGAAGAGGLNAGHGERDAADTPPSRPGIEVKATTINDEPLRLRLNRPQTLIVAPGAEVRDRLAAAIRPAEDSNDLSEPMQFSVRNIKYPADFPDVVVRAYLNMPGAHIGTGTSDPHYIGRFGFFGASMSHDVGHGDDAPHGEGHGQGGMTYGHLFNLGPVIKRLGDTVRPDQPLQVTLILVPTREEADSAPKVAPDLTLPYTEAALIIGELPRPKTPEPPSGRVP